MKSKKKQIKKNRFVDLPIEIITDITNRSSFLSHSTLIGFISLIGVYWTLIASITTENSSKLILFLSIFVIFAISIILIWMSYFYFKQEKEARLAFDAKKKILSSASVPNLRFCMKNGWYMKVVILLFTIHILATVGFVLIITL